MAERLLPLFPLPGVVHFPGTELPLHVFEPRYRQLVADLFESPPEERLVGVILLDRDPESGQPVIVEPGCAGLLTAHQPLEDGRSNIVLAGAFRFLLGVELPGRLYRRALVEVLDDRVPALELERAERLDAELARLVAEVETASGRRLPAPPPVDSRAAGQRLVPFVNALAVALDLPPERQQELLGLPPLERAEQVAGILRSRRKLFRALAPYRHLSATAALN